MLRRPPRWLWDLVSLVFGIGLAVAYVRFVWNDGVTDFLWKWRDVDYRLLAPRWLGLVLAVPLILAAVHRSLADLPPVQLGLLVVVRSAFLALLAFALARPVRTAESQQVATIVLLDVSDSAPDEALADARRRMKALAAARADGDRIRLVTFAARPREIVLGRGAEVPSVKALRHRAVQGRANPGAGSDIEAAMQFAYGLMPPGYLKRVVIFSDGLETAGDALAEVSRARSLGIRVFSSPYSQAAPGEVAVTGLVLPNKVDIGQAFKVVAQVYASRKTTARARLYQGEVLNGIEGVRHLELHPGENRVQFESVVRVGGETTYSLKLDEIAVDQFSANNAYAATIDVPGRPRVLYVDGQPAQTRYLASALTAQQFDVDVRTAAAFPGSLQELSRYDFVILSDVAKQAIRLESHALIERYVRDVGGGFLFAGGEQGFGLGGWGHTSLERLLPVRMDVQRRRDTPGVAMVLVIDRSGSMSGLPIEMAKAACRATLDTLEGNDLIEVIAFDSAPIRYVKMQPSRYRVRIQSEVARIQPGGGTEIFRALDMAYQDVSVVQARKKHVILLTDGQASKDGVAELVQAMIAESITVTTVGLGSGVDREFLRSVASGGGGRYHDVPDPNNLPRIFTKETEMIARQAAVEEWFPVQQTSPADFLKGVAIGAAPLLHGYVATELKPAPAQLILASDRGEPILARWRVGLGQVLAWTSDVKNHWAVDWLRWAGFSKFWGQLVREHMRHERNHELDMQTEVVGDEVHAVVDAFTPSERFDNDLVSALTVQGPQPGGEEREVSMRQTAPGRYEARFRLEEYGSFLLRAKHGRDMPDGARKPVSDSYGRVSNPYPREYSSFEPDRAKMARIAELGGGEASPDPPAVFDPGDARVRYHKPLWPLFVAAALGFLLVDLLLRRVRLFDRQFHRSGQPRLS